MLLLRLTSDLDSPTYAPHIARVTGVHHYTQLFAEMGVSLIFFLAWP
jgi:hypothetical protein